MPFTIVRADITTLATDAIVNAANPDLRQGGGVCGAIFRAAGAAAMRAACAPLAPIKTGSAVITPGFGLPARYVIHTVGPVYRDGQSGEKALLISAYRSALELAVLHDLERIAFPLISSGIYGYPKDEALAVATSTIRSFLAEAELDVCLVVFDRTAFTLSRELQGAVEAYIDQHYVDLRKESKIERYRQESRYINAPLESLAPMRSTAPDAFVTLADSFAERLFELIAKRRWSDVDVYKRANLDRKLFSKIRNNKDYTPSKRTAVALAIALELPLETADDLLGRAGYAFSQSRLDDVIVMYFIEKGVYDLFAINEVLFTYGQPLLGA